MDSSRLLAKIRNAVRMLEGNECGLDEMQEEAAMRAIDYYVTGNSHFGELSARGCIAQMYYVKGEREKVFAPYFSYEDVKEVYGQVKDEIAGYNVWDFAVTMNLMYSNYHSIIDRHDDKLRKTCEISVEFLNDEDSNHPDDKIWWYVNNS